MEGQPRFAAKHDGISGSQAQGTGRTAAIGATDPKQRAITERERDDRGGEILLVAVLMQAHFGDRSIIVDQAALRWVRVAAKLVPSLNQDVGNRRPRFARLGMGRLIAVAAFVRDPAERSAI